MIDGIECHQWVAWGMLIVSLPLFILLRWGIKAPYGKHSSASRKWGPTINAKLAWALFEAPNLAWALYAILSRDEEVFDSTNIVLFSLFVVHYINRCIIYPMMISRNSRPVNLSVITSGFLFCFANGL